MDKISMSVLSNTKSKSRDEDDDINNSKDKRRRRRNQLSPRSIALNLQTNKRKYFQCLGVLFVLFWVAIAIVGIIANMIPNRVSKANLNSHPEKEHLQEYECIGWHTTAGFYPFAIPRLWRFIKHFVFRRVSLPCNIKVQPDETGYCELRHKQTGKPLYLLDQTYDGSSQQGGATIKSSTTGETITKRPNPVVACIMAHQLLEFQKLLKQQQQQQQDPTSTPVVSLPELQQQLDSGVVGEQRRGILIYFQPQKQDEIVSVYSVVQLLRLDYNCQLPIELWFHGGEDELHDNSIFENPIWLKLLEMPNVSYRIHWDYRYEDVGSIPYSIVHTTKFEEVLVLGKVTSYPIQDPTSLFDNPHYQETGALFWKDLFSPQVKETTIKDLLWDTLGLPTKSPIRTEMEMDDGQFVINRSKSQKPLQLLMLMNRVPWFPLLKSLRIMQSNKDLYRLAWHLTHKEFAFVDAPPALLAAAAAAAPVNNKKHKEEDLCTQTLLQHSPQQQQSEGTGTNPIPLFVHFRGNFTTNFVTTTTKQHENEDRIIIWDHGEYFKGIDSNGNQQQQYSLGSYWAEPEGDMDIDDVDPTQPCYYIKSSNKFEQRSLQDSTNTNLAQLESRIRKYVQEAVALRETKKQQK